MVNQMKKNEKYELLGNIISLINSEEYESSINSMAKVFNIPIEYMRKVIVSLLNNHIFQSCINAANDLDYDDVTFIENYIDYPDLYSKKILEGDFDDLLWEINFNVLDSSEEELLTLSHIEYGAITLQKEDIISLKRGSIFEKKDTVKPVSSSIRKNQEIIQNAINNKQEIVFTYKKDSGTEQKRCFPREIFANVSDNWLYFYSTENKSYRLDRIIHSCKIVSSSTPYPEIEEDLNKKYVWGIYRGNDTEPTHVKIKIYPETKNLISKIKRDISLRKLTSKFYQDGNFFYYEDDIIGMDEFQRWIRGYGSSIEVLEPLSLRNTIVERARITLNNYNASKDWRNL